MPTTPGPGLRADLALIDRTQRVTLGAAAAFTLFAAVVEAAGAGELVRFVVAGLALAALAGVVGEAVDALGERLGPSVTGLLQSTLGNLPELFVGFFALRQGLDGVVRSALVGSVLGNVLLVLGCAFMAGGLRHGTQRFAPEEPRLTATLLLLAVAALLVPTLASRLGTPAAAHPQTLSYLCAAVLLVVYASSVTWSLGRAGQAKPEPAEGTWSLRLAVVVLVAASAGSALASDWFVGALEPASRSLGLSQTFTGLVVVAIASNAVEHVVGIRFAWAGKADLTISTTLSSPLQIALFLTPVLILISAAVGPNPLTLVFPPLLVAALGVSAVVVAAVVFDGEYTWVEGVALVGLYVMIAGAVWWG
jgi:Ca2+:H+ antiporter